MSAFIACCIHSSALQTKSCADPEVGDRGSGPPEKHKNKGFLSNAGPDPLKSTKQLSMLGHHRPASETPFKWRFADGPDNGPLLLLFG